MPLSESDAREAYSALVDALREVNLVWVIEQVEATIALGKPNRRRLDPSEISEGAWRWLSRSEKRSRRGPHAVFVVADEFSARERLDLLGEAIRAAVIETADFADAIHEALEVATTGDSPAFLPELESGQGFSLERADHAGRREAIRQLAALLRELLDDEEDASTPRIAF